ncbi:MAG: hypothetical protein JWQ98_474 [Chlorobi bacterium]|nr:hypothetical protein [Chlorobiota bacterium]
MSFNSQGFLKVRSLLGAWMGGAFAGALVALCVSAGALGTGEALSFMVFIFIINCAALFPLLVLVGLLLILIRRRAPGLLANRLPATALIGIGAGMVQGGMIFTIATVIPFGHGSDLIEFRSLLAATGALSGLVAGGLMAMSATAAMRSASSPVEPGEDTAA